MEYFRRNTKRKRSDHYDYEYYAEILENSIKKSRNRILSQKQQIFQMGYSYERLISNRLNVHKQCFDELKRLCSHLENLTKMTTTCKTLESMQEANTENQTVFQEFPNLLNTILEYKSSLIQKDEKDIETMQLSRHYLTQELDYPLLHRTQISRALLTMVTKIEHNHTLLEEKIVKLQDIFKTFEEEAKLLEEQLELYANFHLTQSFYEFCSEHFD